MDKLTHFPVEILLAGIAVAGGIARYATAYRDGAPFKWGMLFASITASGFAGVMFGLLGVSMNLPQPLIFAMTGAGGFFADQSLKLVMDFVSGRVGTKKE